MFFGEGFFLDPVSTLRSHFGSDPLRSDYKWKHLSERFEEGCFHYTLIGAERIENYIELVCSKFAVSTLRNIEAAQKAIRYENGSGEWKRNC